MVRKVSRKKQMRIKRRDTLTSRLPAMPMKNRLPHPDKLVVLQPPRFRCLKYPQKRRVSSGPANRRLPSLHGSSRPRPEQHGAA